ncbi:phosphomannomutase [Mitsuokella sp. WILCCON 0060]|uniref:phosphomannomutase n=1 Tax=unclassified Mitsuokella TaxID=2637239 RepID=UPI003F12577E
MNLSAKGFGAFDIRGLYPEVINEELAYRIGRAFPALFDARKIAVGRDIRLSSPALQEALVKGLTEAGCDVMDLELCGTEMIYFAVLHHELDGGIMVTGSHNTKKYNGFQLVRRGAQPISEDTGLKELAAAVMAGNFATADEKAGHVEKMDVMDDYIDYLLSYVDLSALKPFKVVANTGNGSAGPVINAIEKKLPFDIVKIHNIPDGDFPNGVPNPLLPENREATAKIVREEEADLGVAWDGDFDRCFLFDKDGNCIDGYYLVGLLAEAFLKKQSGEKIVYDPRLIWNTEEVCRKFGGVPVISRSGHAFIKDKMRDCGAVYGGEMSSHHYFRDFSYCDSGMIPWLLVMELLSKTEGSSLSDFVKACRERYPISGEINSRVEDADDVMAKVEAAYAGKGEVTKIDGLSIAFDKWRFNLRKSNTEPVLRLNVETRGDKKLCQEKTDELLQLIRT